MVFQRKQKINIYVIIQHTTTEIFAGYILRRLLDIEKYLNMPRLHNSLGILSRIFSSNIKSSRSLRLPISP